jgi:hypothetical protein
MAQLRNAQIGDPLCLLKLLPKAVITTVNFRMGIMQQPNINQKIDALSQIQVSGTQR